MKKRHFESTNSLFPEEAFAPLPEKGQPDDIPHPTRADYNDLFERLSRSAFRSGFHLSEKDRIYVRTKGWDTLRHHAADFIAQRLAPAVIPNDGKQTPMRGHPVFIAQHATGTCCRKCLSKWHGIEPGNTLTQQQQHYIVNLIMAWIRKEIGLALHQTADSCRQNVLACRKKAV